MRWSKVAGARPAAVMMPPWVMFIATGRRTSRLWYCAQRLSFLLATIGTWWREQRRRARASELGVTAEKEKSFRYMVLCWC